MRFVDLIKNKITLSYTIGALALLLFLKLAPSDFFKDIVDFTLSFLPFIIIFVAVFAGYFQFRKFKKENPNVDYSTYLQYSRVKYLAIILQMLAVTLLFYILYSPKSFVPYGSIFKTSFRLLNPDNIFILATYSLLAFIFIVIIWLFSKFYLKSQNLYQGDIQKTFKKSLYSTFLFSFILFVFSVLLYPEAYRPMMNYTGNMVYDLIGGKEDIAGIDPLFIGQSKINHSLKDALNQTYKNLAGNISQSNQKLSTDIQDTKETISNAVDQTVKDTKNTLAEDIEDKLDLDGGTLSGDLTIKGNLSIKDASYAQDIIPQSDDTYDLGSVSKGWSNLYVSHIYGSAPVAIGGASSSHSLSGTGDLIVSGDLEINGTTYFDSVINLSSNKIVNLGTPTESADAATKGYVDAQLGGVTYFQKNSQTISPADSADSFAVGGLTISSAGIITGAGGNISQWTNDSLYLTSYTETDPIFVAHQAHNITAQNIIDLGNLTGTNSGDETLATIKTKLGISTLSGSNTGDNATNSLYSGLASSKQDALNGIGFIKISGTTISYDNSAYLTSLTETDPIFLAHQAHNITATDITNLSNLSGINTGDQDLSGYALLAGRVGGQTLIGGTGVADILKLQGTSGNGTLTSPAIEMLVGDNGATNALTVLNNGNVGFGNIDPTVALELGTATVGQNEIINATEGSEMITNPITTGGWSLGSDGTGAWTITGGVLTKTASAGTLTALAVSDMATVTAGRVYKISITASAVTSSGVYMKIGNNIGRYLVVGTTTEYMYASNTTKLSLLGSSSSTATIESISVKEITPSTGDLNVFGKIIATGGIYSPNGTPILTTSYDGKVAIGGQTASPEGYTFLVNGSSKTSAVVRAGSNLETPYIRGATGASSSGYLYLDDGANIISQRNSTNQQIFRFYNTYTNATNYERLSVTGVQGTGLNITAETGGTGADNLNLTLTPAGAGLVTLAGNTSITGNAAASTPIQLLSGTWYTSGTATTNKPQLLVEPAGTTSTNWSLNGTGLGVNAPSGFTGNLLNLQTNNSSKFKVDYDGSVISSGQIQSASSVVTATNVGTLISNYYYPTFAQTGTGQAVRGIALTPTYNQPSATSVQNTDLLINRTETSLGTTPGAQYLIDAQVGGSSKFSVSNAGAGYLAAASWTYGSDRKMKENITQLSYGLDDLMKINPVKFDYIAGQKDQLGFIAQDMQKIIPEIVKSLPNDMLGIQTEGLIPVIINSIQEQQGQILTIINDQDTNTKSIADLRIELQKQIDDLQSQIATPVNIAQIELNTNDISYIKQLLNIDTNKAGDVSIVGKFTAEKIISNGVETGNIKIKIIDLTSPTIGDGIILAEKNSQFVPTNAVTEKSKIYITPIGSTDNQVIYIGKIDLAGEEKNGNKKGFEVKVDRIEKVVKTDGIETVVGPKEIKFNWWIVDTELEIK